jgi:hypothetical protein
VEISCTLFESKSTWNLNPQRLPKSMHLNPAVAGLVGCRLAYGKL